MKLTNFNQVQTMSSREIAELTNKNHFDVMRDIRKIVEELGQSIFAESSYINSQNKSQPEYLLNKENSLLVVSGYSVILRKKIIDRWQELESKTAFKMPTTRELCLMVIAREDEIERLQIELDESKDWLSIKRVAQANGVTHKNIPWRPLKAAGEAIGYSVRKVFDSNYGAVNVYHRDVWKAVYPSLNLPNGEI